MLHSQSIEPCIFLFFKKFKDDLPRYVTCYLKVWATIVLLPRCVVALFFCSNFAPLFDNLEECANLSIP